MTDHVITAANSVTTTEVEDLPAFALTAGDTLLVAADGILKTQGTSYPAVLAPNGSVAITVDGLVQGEELHAIDITAGGNTITVGATGQVLANPAGDGGYGLRLRGFNGSGDNTVINNGLISGLVGISQAAISGNLTVVNNGTIIGFPSDAAAAIAVQGGNNSITNNGQLFGNVFVGAGNDFYDGTNGTILGKIVLNEGNDTAYGGVGDEVFLGGADDDTLIGGGGIDTAVYTGLDGFGVIVDITVDLNQAGAQDTGEGVDTLGGIENLVSGAGNDILIGDDQANTLDGGAGDDVLSGGGGNDVLVGGAGRDTLDGSEGTDTALFGDEGYEITLSLGSAASPALAAPESLSGIENVSTGAGEDLIAGSDEANVLDGGAGNDTLVGHGGDDTLIGGEGIDTATFVATDGSGNIVDAMVDLTKSGAQQTGWGLDSLIGIENVTGAAGNDTFVGDSQDNQLDGAAGNDTLTGGLGDDVLTGGDGIDTAVFLGLGSGGVVDVTVDLNATGPQDTGEGVDTLSGIENITGGAGSDALVGDGQANVLDGGAGNDTLTGGDGDDVLLAGGGTDTLNGGSGKDQAYVEGDGSLVTFSGIEIIAGGAGDDIIALDQDAFDVLELLEGAGGSDTVLLGGGVFDFTQASLAISGVEGFTLTADNTKVVFDGVDEALLVDAKGVSGAAVEIKSAVLTDAERKALYDKGFATVTQTVSFTAAPETPIVAPVTVDEDGIASVVIVRAPSDGSEVTHYQITGITNGTLYRDAARTQVIIDGAFIEADGLTTTLYFKPDADFAGDASFMAQASLGASAAGLGGGVAEATITVTQVADAPAGLSLTGSVAAELSDTGTIVGTLSASDADPGTTLTYTLVDNAGGRFALSGDKLVVANGVGLDFEQPGTHTVKVRVDDGTGRFIERNFTVAVSDIGTESTAGTGGNDTVFGGAGRDNLAGGGGNDHLAGGANRDTLNGGAGRDRLDGDLGIDRLTGGADRDIFMFDTKLGSSNVDVVVDFNVRDDSFQLDNAVFRKLGAGTLTKPGKLSKDAFYVGKTAEDREDRILYDRSTGALSYDADGTGSAKAVKFATLKKGLALTYHDFFVI